MENAVVYARYSSHSQTEQSIEGQLNAARNYASLHNYNIIHEYCDRAKTGTNDNREEFQHMLHDCQKKKFSVVIVWKVDRFGRNREEIAFNKHHCKKYGVRVEYVAENISQGPEGVILESVLEGMAEYYSLQLSQNIKRGMLEGAKKHHVLFGKPAFGYKTASDKTYELDPISAPVVKMIFEKYNGGMRMAELTKWLNDNGYRNRNGKHFTKNSLPKILHNELYKGAYIFKDIIYDEDAVEPIVSKELFASVQNKLGEYKRMPSRSWSYSEFLLTGKIYCGLCGSPMIGTSGNKPGKKYNYYTCVAHRDKKCKKGSVSRAFLEDLVLTECIDVLNDEEFFNKLVDAVWNYYQTEDDDFEEQQRLQNIITDIDKSMTNLMNAVEKGLDYSLVKNRLEELQSEKNNTECKLREMELAKPIKLTRDHIVYFLDQFRNKDYEDRKIQQRLIETLLHSVFVYDDHVEIKLNTSEESPIVRPCAPSWSLTNNSRTPIVVDGVIILTIPLPGNR